MADHLRRLYCIQSLWKLQNLAATVVVVAVGVVVEVVYWVVYITDGPSDLTYGFCCSVIMTVSHDI